jgi:transmembrane sensor
MIDHAFMLKVLRGQASQEEREFLDAWLKESDARKEEFAALTEVWERTGQTDTPAIPDPGVQWGRIEARVHGQQTASSGLLSDRAAVKQAERVRRRRMSIRAVGIGLLLVVVMTSLTTGIFWLAGRGRPTSEGTAAREQATPVEREYTTGNGRRATIPLPDGTVVSLNAASKLRIDPAFGGTERRVVLEGEAFFAVAHDPSRPFRVFTGASFTEVRGTEFGVRNRRNKIEVVVSRGKVRVVSRTKGGAVDLVRGQGVTATVAGELSQPHRVDLHESLAWRENRFAFKKTPLDEVMAEIEEVYDLHVEFKTPAVRSRTLTGNFSVDSIDVVLSQIALAMDVSVHRDGRNVVVR